MSRKTQEISLSKKKETLYNLHKQIGLRDQAGRWKLKSLKPRHKAMAAASAQGWSNTRIAEEFGVTTQTVSRILNDPLVEEFLQGAYLGLQQEVRGLGFKAIDAARDALDSPDPDQRIKGISAVEKLYKMFTPEGRDSAKAGGFAFNLNINRNEEEENKQDVVEKLGAMLEDLGAKIDGKATNTIDAEEIEYEEVGREENDKGEADSSPSHDAEENK